jgi:hypothetical protein
MIAELSIIKENTLEKTKNFSSLRAKVSEEASLHNRGWFVKKF